LNFPQPAQPALRENSRKGRLFPGTRRIAIALPLHTFTEAKMNAEAQAPQAPTLLPDADPILRLVPMPTDTNYAGDVFGGWIMAQVDIAGSIPAIRRARGRVATVAVNSFVFKQPVYVGDLVSFYANITRVGRTSITVDVSVYAQRGLRQGNGEICNRVTEAVLTYVAVDDNRRPRVVPEE
jgi:acyl-CoA thioesterase YciA